jgi:D-arabinose 1-dehydrogenase-like Zn-dependent alcohol dehydrogenase
MNRVLATTGKDKFVETEYDIPIVTKDEICVRAVMTGVCRSDIDMMQGYFGPLPLHMQGHEGLGKVIGIGADVTDVKLGDYVATRGEPAYADVYNVRKNEYVKVPLAHPRYIIEPVACGINIVEQPRRELEKRQGGRLLILGSGFLAWVAYHDILWNKFDFEIDVVGSANKSLWKDKLKSEYTGKYDVVIDLSGKEDPLTKDIYNVNALVIFGSQKNVTTDFRYLLWNACTMVFPSPRNDEFYYWMKKAVFKIENNELDVDSFWTKGYNRDTEWQQAFADGVNRPQGYSRGYIFWENNGY